MSLWGVLGVGVAVFYLWIVLGFLVADAMKEHRAEGPQWSYVLFAPLVWIALALGAFIYTVWALANFAVGFVRR